MGKFKPAYSVGIELECVFAVSTVSGPSGDSLFARSFSQFAELVRDGLKAGSEQGVSGFNVEIQPTPTSLLEREDAKIFVRENFVVKPDYTIFVGPEDIFPRPFQDSGVELTTPALTEESWSRILPHLMSHLKESKRVAFNDYTGLHFHIGKMKEGQYTKYTTKELKQVAKAVLLFENQMSTLHPGRDPQGENGLRHYKFCGDSDILRNLGMKQKIEMITNLPDGGDDVGRLIRCINPGWFESERNYVFNFESFLKYGTIESRQPGGTLDHERILDLITRTTSLINRAIETSDGQFLEWATNGIHDPSVYKEFGVPAPEKP